MQKHIRLASLLAVLFLAAYLRVTGLSWGLTSGYGHLLNFQPDEFVSLRGVLQIDLLAGRLKVPGAYFEGTFNYYLWALPQAVLQLVKKKADPLHVSSAVDEHADLLYLCRWMSVVFDLCTVVIVFAAISEVTQSFYPALLGAVCYAVLPMQVIYSHFMRTHTLSNLLCGLVIWLSLKVWSRSRWWIFLGAGLVSGLAAATRYPAGIIAVIPCLYFLFDRQKNFEYWAKRFSDRLAAFVKGPLWLMTLGFLVGLFIGHPELFLDSRSVINAITGETMRYASLQEFSAHRLLNFAVIWRYVSYLIPFAMYPALWLLTYCAIFYLLFRKKLYNRFLPILIFCFLYLYFMAKGYLGPYFARATMPLFPAFCILVGLAYGDLLRLLREWRKTAIILTVASLGFIAPSVVFDLAYAYTMQQKDPRSALREDLDKLTGSSPTTIAVSPWGPYFYTVTPAVEPLKSKGVTIQVQDGRQGADFFLIGFGCPIDTAQRDATIRRIEQQGNFKYERTYRICPTVLGREIPLARFPRDMTYPFPTILLFRGNTERVTDQKGSAATPL